MYVKVDDLKKFFEYDYHVKTKILTIEQFEEIVEGLKGDKE